MVGNEEHGKSGLFGQLFGTKRTRRAKSAFGDHESAGGASDGAAPRHDAETVAAAHADVTAAVAPTAAPDTDRHEPADAALEGARPADETAAATPAADAAAQPEAADDASAEAASTDSVAPEADPLAEITPFSPFSVRDAAPITAPAAPVVEIVAPIELTFKEPELPDRDDDEEPDLPEHVESVRRRTRKRDGSRRSRQSDDDADEQSQESSPRSHRETPTKVKGSTRLEAKKQRRNASRDAGRRRQSVTEVEFQARREAVDRQMIVRSTEDRIQIGVLEDDILVEHYAAHSRDLSLIGNVYLGRIQNVLPSMEAAFVDIGRGRNAVLYSGEVDWEAAEVTDKQRRIEMALKAGDTVLVQVTKDPVGHKGARLTSQISLPGRYLVYVPGGSMSGISRKLPDSERSRLKKTLKEILPENVGVIVRTAAEGATKEQLERDVTRLQQQWEEIQRLRETQQAPALLHTEPNLLIKVVRDVFNEDITKMVISGGDAEATIEKYLHTIAPDLVDRVEHYSGDKDIFDAYRINEQLAKASERKVFLPSGGSLVIDRTEAMTVIDVNTGKFVGSGGNLEETVTKNNLEAAEEIVRQLRLRDLGGIVVVDFIDMVLESNRDLVLQRLIECLGRDRTKHQVAEVTSLGLIQMTRKKIGIGLAETFTQLGESSDSVQGTHGSQSGKPGSARKPRSKKTQTVKSVKNTLNANVKNAVAQVAASTIAQTASTPAAEARAVEAPAPSAATPQPASAHHSHEPAGPASPAESGSSGSVTAAHASTERPASVETHAQAKSWQQAEPTQHPQRRSELASGRRSRRASAPAGPARADIDLDLDLPKPKTQHVSEASPEKPVDRDALLADVLAHLPEGARTPNSGKETRGQSFRQSSGGERQD
ncbi:Rne/Rng family ribonuclease [Pseudoclavibacter sp. 13-3]|uniref:Rne/Rng family ribonuclease n=1 Tax=Pseudoclavibacter sp. 13-3 TaxID=2901228 RepID=UPI001E3BBB66|nr:Rne/Rng family ribonuclease [Pseudoclavibacter sp. 13-3]MCD7100799.1 Rne/Rng family ribonuclease [Pseudoclavibacter sp. 13-3]